MKIDSGSGDVDGSATLLEQPMNFVLRNHMIHLKSPQVLKLLLIVSAILVSGCGEASDSSGTAAVISGNSMVPAFIGEHIRSVCDHCGYTFDRESDRRGAGRFVCPNCSAQNKSGVDSFVDADRVLIEELNEGEAIDRWDVVAFSRQRGPGEPLSVDGIETGGTYDGIKRVVGLPGETISIYNGDVICNASPVPKTIDRQREMRIPVYDSRFTDPDQPSRWRAAGSDWSLVNSGEKSPGDGIGKFVSLDESCESGSLEYFHVPGYSSPQIIRSDGDSSVSNENSLNGLVDVKDSYSFNQSLSRSLNDVEDLFFEISGTIEPDAEMIVRIQRPCDALELTFPVRGEWFEFSTGSETCRTKLDHAVLPGGKFRLEISTIDGVLKISDGGKAVCSIRLAGKSPRDLQALDPGTIPNSLISMSGKGGGLKIDRVRIWRDIYYFVSPPAGPVDPGPPKDFFRELGPDEYFVLGDNVPVSIDSRHFKRPLTRAGIIGVVRSLKK